MTNAKKKVQSLQRSKTAKRRGSPQRKVRREVSTSLCSDHDCMLIMLLSFPLVQNILVNDDEAPFIPSSTPSPRGQRLDRRSLRSSSDASRSRGGAAAAASSGGRGDEEEKKVSDK
jgi:hypothetical protein